MCDKKELSIFISYGHINNHSGRKVPVVVDLIVEKLKDRKHRVWIDYDKLPDAAITNWPDSDWRSAIYNAINKSDDVVGFLSERSLRQSGVCLDELSIAVAKPGRRIVTVLLESQNTMKIPPTISRIQWVDMSDWEAHYDKSCHSFLNDGYFDQKMSEIVERIEQEENYVYQYDINFLLQTLCPSNTINTDLIELLKCESDAKGNLIYEERAWLEAEFYDFITSEQHYMLLTGGPGYGKSQFLAHCIHNIEDVYAYYFLKYNKQQEEKNCNLLLRTLAFELAAKMPEYRSSLIDSIKSYPEFNENRLADILNFYMSLSDRELFDFLFHSDSIHFIDGNVGGIIICIDALDEVDQGGRNTVVDLMMNTKGSWPDFFKFVLTSRTTGSILNCFDYFENDIQIVRMDVKQSDNDVKQYLRKRLRRDDINDHDLDVLVQSCEKTFIYARLLIQSIEEGYIEMKTVEDIRVLPKGYKGLLQHYFQNAFSGAQFEKVRMPLGIMITNGGSIDRSVFERIMKRFVPGWNVPEFLLQMKSFVVLQGDLVCFYHKALSDWLCDTDAAIFYIDASIYKESVLDFCRQVLGDFNRIAENDYAFFTGMELFSDAPENGFDYKIVKFVFKSCLSLMKKVECMRFKRTETAFLTLVLWEAYKNTELLFVNEVFDIIRQNARRLEDYQKRERFYIMAAYNIRGVVEQAKGNQIPDSGEEQKKQITADNCRSAIEYFWFIRDHFQELSEYANFYSSVMENVAFNTRLLNQKSASNLELALSILEELRVYDEKQQVEGIENNLAHLYYYEGIIYYDMRQFDKVEKCLDKAEYYITLFAPEEYERGEGFLALVLNQRAGTCNKIAEAAREEGDYEKADEYYRKSLSDMKESLDKRIKYYGPFSFYVALAYDNYARFLCDFESAQQGFSCLSDTVYEYVKKAIEIKKRIFSENGKTTARSYMTMAKCLCADRAFDEKMVDFIRRGMSIDPDGQRKYATEYIKRAIQYLKQTDNAEMLTLFENEMSSIRND